MKNAFFTLKALFVLEIFQFLLYIFDHAGKRLDQKAKLNLKIYDIANCQISQEVKATKQ